MATFRNRNGKWQVRVRRKGQPAVVKSFQTKQDGERYAIQVESDIDKGAYTNLALAERTTLKELIERYIVEVTAPNRSAKEDTFRLKALSRDPLAALNVTGLTLNFTFRTSLSYRSWSYQMPALHSPVKEVKTPMRPRST